MTHSVKFRLALAFVLLVLLGSAGSWLGLRQSSQTFAALSELANRPLVQVEAIGRVQLALADARRVLFRLMLAEPAQRDELKSQDRKSVV